MPARVPSTPPISETTRAEVHADAPTLAAAVDAVRGAALLVTVGSGTIADIGKYTSAQLDGLPHVVVQTAASVNGFADDQSVLVVDGVKRTTPTRWPDRLVIDTDVVGLAPPVMNQAGLGDLLATYTAPADWLLARFVGQDDSFSPAVVTLARDHVDAAVDAAEGIAAGDPAAIELLAAALTLSGISMGVAGRTAPGSGMEHTVSHLLEMTEARGRHAARRQGRRTVGFRRVPVGGRPRGRRRRRSGGAAVPRRGRDGGPGDRGVRGRRSQRRDGGRVLERLPPQARPLACGPPATARRWPTAGRGSTPTSAGCSPRPSAWSRPCSAPQAPVRLSDLGIDPERGRWALAHCHLMRDRFTIADLAFFMGRWEPADVDALIARVGALGGGL